MQELENSTSKTFDRGDAYDFRVNKHFQKEACLAVDIKMGWKPKLATLGAPIPLYYEFNQY